MEENVEQTYEILDLCLLAGKIMLQNGAETYRVEDTMMRMAKALGIPETHSYVTPTGIFFSAEGAEPTKTRLIRIADRTTDLRKVTLVNNISRQIAAGEITFKYAHQSLKEIEVDAHSFSLFVRTVAAAVASGCFLIMFKGGWSDFVPAMVSGGVGYFSSVYLHKLVPIKFFSEFTASFLLGLIAFIFVKIGIGSELDKIIIGSVMPLVPGLLLTNAVRDLMAGHLVSGLSKGAEAMLTAFAIGSGIAIVLSFL
ncbi:threonine/serine exporter family protein [Bacillus marasmi]|uniref:threonine/serine exporter family protein n=1 Tax=Bacillus marasmi TaxID=1926279 RepID=UPI003CCC8DB9